MQWFALGGLFRERFVTYNNVIGDRGQRGFEWARKMMRIKKLGDSDRFSDGYGSFFRKIRIVFGLTAQQGILWYK